MGSDLQTFYPFNQGDAALTAEAKRRGLVQFFKAGGIILNSGENADRISLILEGQVLCTPCSRRADKLETKMSPGCFIGLESMTDKSVCLCSAVARTPVKIVSWLRSDAQLMASSSIAFSQALSRLDKGRVYQENAIVPEVDPSEPVLAIERQHIIMILAKYIVTLLAVTLFLWLSNVLLRQTPIAAAIFITAILSAAVWYLYKSTNDWKNEQLIITPKNIICLPRSKDAEPDVIRLTSVRSVNSENLPLTSLISIGTLLIDTWNQSLSFPLVADPQGIGAMISAYRNRLTAISPTPAAVSAPANPASVTMTTEPVQAPASANQSNIIDQTDESFESYEFHAHWAHLVSMELKPVILLLALLFLVINGIRGHWKILTFNQSQPILICLFILLICWIIYAFLDWINDKFIIEEDCVKDYNRKPFAREDINIAMIQKVQSVRFKRDGIFQMLFNYGTVYILAYDSELSFNFVPRPQKIQQLILETCARFEMKRKSEEEERQHNYIADLVHTIKNS